MVIERLEFCVELMNIAMHVIMVVAEAVREAFHPSSSFPLWRPSSAISDANSLLFGGYLA